MTSSPRWIGFDLGGTKMLASLVDDDLKIIRQERTPTLGHEGPKSGLARIIKAIEEVAGDDRKRLAGIGMACPGVVNMRKGILREAPNLGWSEVPIGKILEDHFKVPVQILNDVDAGAYGEYSHGAGQGASTLLAVFPGTGIGGGCVINGQLLTGKSASCMEIGHLHFPTAGLLGDKGSPQVMETICSRLGIASAAAAEAYRGNAPNLMKAGGFDIQKIRSGVIAKSIAGGDKAIEKIVRNAVHYLSIAIAGAVDLLGPDVVVLGGGLVEKLPDFFLRGVRKGIDKFASRALAEEVEVREAKLGDDAVVVGAASFAKTKANDGNGSGRKS
ncbi:MAG: glucokinase [Verrucomicrobiales bacterium]|jgi:glucokinase